MSKYNGRYLRVRNLPKYQHYKHRNPPWIKLHRELLDDYDFAHLPDASKAHALCLMLLAARLDNFIPYDPLWIAQKIQAQSPVDLDGLLEIKFIEVAHGASKPLASRKQNATLEREGEKSTTHSVRSKKKKED